MTRGVRQIVRFNWPFYAGATLGVAAASLVIGRVPREYGCRVSRCTRRSAVSAIWIVASLVASWIVYDRSPLMRWDWIDRGAGIPAGRVDQHPRGARRIDDGVARAVRTRPGRVFDIFDPAEMTEPSIARARRLADNDIAAETVDFRHLPVADRHHRRGTAAALGARAANRRDARRALHRAASRPRARRARRRRRAPARLGQLPGVRAGLPALPLAPHLDALLRPGTIRHPVGVPDHAVRSRLRPEEVDMTSTAQTLLVHFRVVGVVMAGLVVVNLFVPRRFHWREEMARLSLLNRQIFQAHAVFLVLTLALFSALLLTCGDALLEPTPSEPRGPDRPDDLLGPAHADAVVLLFAGDLARTPLQHGDALRVLGDLGLRVDGVCGRALDNARLTRSIQEASVVLRIGTPNAPVTATYSCLRLSAPTI